MRIDPNSIYFKGMQVEMEYTSPCQLCKQQNQSWDELMSTCTKTNSLQQTHKKLTKDGAPLNLNKILTSPDEPSLWLLFKILINKRNRTTCPPKPIYIFIIHPSWTHYHTLTDRYTSKPKPFLNGQTQSVWGSTRATQYGVAKWRAGPLKKPYTPYTTTQLEKTNPEP